MSQPPGGRSRALRRLGPPVVRAVVRHLPPRGHGIRLAHAWTRWCPPDGSVMVSRERGGARLHCDLRDQLSRVIYYRGWVDAGLERWLRAWLRPGDVYADVGAHIGSLAALAALAVGPGGRVVAFEPSPATYAHLARAFTGHRFAHVETVPAAVAGAGGQATLFTPAGGRWAHQAYRASLHAAPDLGAGTGVDTVSLDGFFGRGRLRLVKVDVEGGEAAVLEGAARLLDEGRCDAWLVELNPPALAAAGSSVADLVQRLGAAGYRAHRLAGDGTAEPWSPVVVDTEFTDAVFLPG